MDFVKKVEFIETGIKIDVGKLSFSGYLTDDDGNLKEKVKCYLGHYNIIIGDKVTIKNLHPIEYAGHKYHHMHIKGGIICWGEWEEKIIGLLNSFKYKELIYLVYAYLKSYNKDDCYCSFNRYYSQRKVEHLFDEDGKLLKKLKQGKLISKEIMVGARVRLRKKFKVL